MQFYGGENHYFERKKNDVNNLFVLARYIMEEVSINCTEAVKLHFIRGCQACTTTDVIPLADQQ